MASDRLRRGQISGVHEVVRRVDPEATPAGEDALVHSAIDPKVADAEASARATPWYGGHKSVGDG